MSISKMTVFGMNQYMRLKRSDLFGLLELPEGIDKETLVDTILLRSAEFEVLYSDGDFFQSAIGAWGRKHYRTFERWKKALEVEYNPLENYDRIESTEDVGRLSNNSKDESNSGTSSYDTKSAFDSPALQPYSGNTSANNSSSNSELEQSTNNVRTSRVHGNIGVTTSQQMLESELNIAEWNIYEHIADLFVDEFCIMVY